MESLVLKPKKLDMEYDEKSDVLYISVGKPKEADDSMEAREGTIFRTRKGEVVGITIIGLMRFSRRERRKGQLGVLDPSVIYNRICFTLKYGDAEVVHVVLCHDLWDTRPIAFRLLPKVVLD